MRGRITPAGGGHQHERGNHLGMLDGQCLRDHPALREADEAGLLDPQVLEGAGPVLGEQWNRVGSVRLHAAPVPPGVAGDDAIPVGEGLRHTPPERVIPPEPMQEDQRTAAPPVHHEEPDPVGVDEPVAHLNRHTR